MEIPVQFLVAGFTAVLGLQAWQITMLYRLASRIRDIEVTLEFNGMKLPELRDV